MRAFSGNMTIHLSLFKRYLGLLLVPMVFGMLLTVSSCETPEKVLKSPDIEYKKSKATFWYNKKEYFKAIPVLEELIGLLKGRQSVEEYYYMYCMANYKQGDFMIAGYHFKNFYDQYTTSARAEECLFMYAKSYMNLSPKPELDQTYTYKALEAYQYFFNMFPVSNYTTEANEAVAKLRRKLEKKALGNAELYYRTSNYKAAAVSYENLLRDYPDIEEAEKVSFMIVKGFMKYAENSIPSRKMERYNYVIKSYNDFKYKYPSSKYLEEAHRYEIAAHYLATKGAFEWAETSPMDEKERHYLTAFAEAKSQAPYLTERQNIEMAKHTEKGYFMIIKNYYLLSEIRKSNQKEATLNQSIKSYYNFVDLFPNSKYMKEAEKLFKNSTEQLKKLKGNG